jgi:cell division protein FtsB
MSQVATPEPRITPPSKLPGRDGTARPRTSEGVPPPLRRRRNAEAPPASPVRSRAINYVLLFVSVVLVVDALIGDKGLLDTLRARRQHEGLVTELAQKKHENARLRDDIRRLKEDPAAIEALAREELGLMREGEVLFIVRDSQTPAR